MSRCYSPTIPTCPWTNHTSISVFLGKQLGCRGRLKAIETQLGIARAAELSGLNGHDAVLLWNRWRHSRDEQARARLLGYNEADCLNLERLADTFYCEMVRQLELGASIPTQ